MTSSKSDPLFLHFQMAEKTKTAEKYMKNVCAISNYVLVLLTQGYHFDDVSLPSISFEKTVKASDWLEFGN